MSITVQVRYDNTDITRDTRWTGELMTTPVANTASGHEINVTGGATLTLNRSRTPQRSNAGPLNDFVWPTILTISDKTAMLVQDSQVLADEPGTTIYVEDLGHIDLVHGKLIMGEGTTLNINKLSDLDDVDGGLFMKVGSQLIIRSTGQTIPGTARLAGGPTVKAYPNPAMGEVTFAWPQGTTAASTAGYTYDLQTLQGVSVRQGRCETLENRLPGVAPGVYLLVLHRADGQRQVQRVAVR